MTATKEEVIFLYSQCPRSKRHSAPYRATQGHTGKHHSKMSRQRRELRSVFVVVFKGKNGRSKTSRWNKLTVG